MRRKLYRLSTVVDFKQNYFQIFQLDVSFQINLEQLSERFHELQLTVHPDKFVVASDQEKRLAAQWASQINAAFDTLKQPLSRAIYLLKLKGIDLEANPNLSPAFLMGQVELRETLEEIEEEGEAALPKLDAFKLNLKNAMTKTALAFGHLYLESDKEKEATQLVYELQFTHKLLIATNLVEEKLLDY